MKIKLCKVADICMVGGGGASLRPNYTNICKILQICVTISPLTLDA